MVSLIALRRTAPFSGLFAFGLFCLYSAWRLHSFGFAYGLALCVGRQRQMCAICVGNKNFNFFERG